MPRRPVIASKTLAFVLAAGLCLPLACSKDEPPPEPAPAEAPAAPVAAAPTKDEVLALLRTVDARLSERDYPGMDALFAIPTGFSADQLAENLAGLQERGEISSRGIDALAARGSFGPATAVLGAERATRFASKFGVPPETCHALVAEPGEVVVCRFPDGGLRLVRLDDVGRLE